MARYSAGARTTAGSTTLPIFSIYAAAGTSPRIVEIGCFNGATTAALLKIVRLTSAGTQGSSVTPMEFDESGPAATCDVRNTHSGNPSLGTSGPAFPVGAAIGAGTVLTFYDQPIVVPVGTGNGLGIIVNSGTGQACDAYFIWDE